MMFMTKSIVILSSILWPWVFVAEFRGEHPPRALAERLTPTKTKLLLKWVWIYRGQCSRCELAQTPSWLRYSIASVRWKACVKPTQTSAELCCKRSTLRSYRTWTWHQGEATKTIKQTLQNITYKTLQNKIFTNVYNTCTKFKQQQLHTILHILAKLRKSATITKFTQLYNTSYNYPNK